MHRQWHHALRGSPAISAGVTLAVVLAFASPAHAATQLFAFLVENGAQFISNADANGHVVFESGGPILSIVNGQKTSNVLGKAKIVVWSRTVADPFFAPFGPIAGLGVLDFDPPFDFRVHLGLIQTPSGLRTTIAVLQQSGFSDFVADPTVRGSWVIANGTAVGGDANDLVIAGLWVFNTPNPLSTQVLDLSQHFPSPVFSSDPTPVAMHQFMPNSFLGSFYGETILNGQSRPVRGSSYTPLDGTLTNWAHLLTIYTGGDGYIVVTCSGIPFTAPSQAQSCAVSGTGFLAGGLTGSARYESLASTSTLRLDRFFVLP